MWKKSTFQNYYGLGSLGCRCEWKTWKSKINMAAITLSILHSPILDSRCRVFPASDPTFVSLNSSHPSDSQPNPHLKTTSYLPPRGRVRGSKTSNQRPGTQWRLLQPTTLVRRARKQRFFAGSLRGVITRGEPFEDAEGGRGFLGERALGAQGRSVHKCNVQHEASPRGTINQIFF